jgi:hypothetical protein
VIISVFIATGKTAQLEGIWAGCWGAVSWAHPVVSDGRLYVRNQDTLLVYDIKAGAR